MLGNYVSQLIYWLRFGLTGGSLITNRSPGFNSDTSIRDEMHCIALVLDATKIPAKGTPLHAKILELKEQIDARGMDLPSNFPVQGIVRIGDRRQNLRVGGQA